MTAKPKQLLVAKGLSGDSACWNAIGTFGDRTCPELVNFVHCRSCPVLSEAAQVLLERPSTAEDERDAAELLAQTPPATETMVPVLVFRVGRELLGLRAGACAAVVEKAPMRALGGRSGKIFRGLCLFRGELTLAVSLRGLLAIDSRSEVQRTRFIAIGEEGSRWVFDVDELIGVRAFAPKEATNVPTERATQIASYVKSIIRVEGEGVGLLDEERLDIAFRRSLVA